MSILRIVAMGAALQMLMITAFADTAVPLLSEARRLLDAGKAEQAVTLLEAELSKMAGNADYDYLLGLALLDAGQPGKALFAFERVVMVSPGNIEARLKAARINLDRGGVAYSRELLAPLSSEQLSARQQAELANLRAELVKGSGGGGVSIRGYLLGGMGWDDNVTSGPSAQFLNIPALVPSPTALGSATRTSDRVGVIEAGVNLSKALSDRTWLNGGANTRWTENRERSDLNEGVTVLSAGLLHLAGNELLGATVALQDYRLEQKTYRRTQSVRLNWTHPFSDTLRLTGYVQGLKFVFPEHSIDDASRHVVGMMADDSLAGGTLTWQYGLYAGKEKAKDPTKPHFSFNLVGAQLGGSVRVNEALSLAAALVYERRDHTATDALYRYNRRDRQISAGLSGDYRLSTRWHLLPQYTYVRNDSNTALYEYGRNTFMLHLRWDFDNEKN